MPRLDALFRFSFYLCLFLSTASLAFAAWGQLADTIVFYIPMLALVALSYWLNDRWTLSVRASNLLALGIIFAWPVWLVVTLRSNRIRSDELEVELVRLALPFFAPLLSTLLLAKLYRPKSVRDFWTIHLMGLVQMVLACVLAMTNKLDRDAPLFPLAVLAYLLVLVWTLRNFNLYSLHMAPTDSRGPRPAPKTADGEGPRARPGLASSLGWFLLAISFGLVVFFLVPRGATSLTTGSFGSFMKAAQTGFKPSMDLSGEGELQVSEELVFRANVRDAAGAAVPLPAAPRWRGVSCAEYDGGRWRPFRKDLMGFSGRGFAAPPRGYLLVSCELDIRKVRQGGAVSTDDVPNRVLGEIPLFVLDAFRLDTPAGGSRSGGVVALDPNAPAGDFVSVHLHQSRQEGCVSATLQEHRPTRNVVYQQLIARNDVSLTDWSQRVPDDLLDGMGEYLNVLAKEPARLRATGRMRQIAEEMLKAEKVPADASREAKAKALERRLVASGGFGYSLNRRRVDATLDPNEDFLLNVKEGTCERYSSALALLLRSVGIPARVVIGFRGADWNSVGQFYEIRELHSHAWVEAVIEADVQQVRLATGENRTQVSRLRWLSLDPTPQIESQNRDQNLWSQNVSFARMLWEFFILDFSGDMQRQRFFSQLNRLGWDKLEEALRRYGAIGVALWVVAFFLSLILAILLLRIFQTSVRNWRAWRKEYAWLPTVPFWRRLIDVMMRRWKLKPSQAQTAAEYAAAAQAKLAASPSGQPLAALPAELAERYYAVRFGDADAAAAAEFTVQLDALARARP